MDSTESKGKIKGKFEPGANRETVSETVAKLKTLVLNILSYQHEDDEQLLF